IYFINFFYFIMESCYRSSNGRVFDPCFGQFHFRTDGLKKYTVCRITLLRNPSGIRVNCEGIQLALSAPSETAYCMNRSSVCSGRPNPKYGSPPVFGSRKNSGRETLAVVSLNGAVVLSECSPVFFVSSNITGHG